MSNRRNQKSVEYESEVDQLLEEWEEQLRSNPQRSLEQFIKALLNRRGQEVIEEFRLQAMALAAIDQQMGRVAGPSPAVDQVSEASSDDWKLASLRPGLEAIPGYTLVSKLGVGGFGEVWKASGPGGFHVALKFVPLGGRAGRIEERSLDVIKDVRHPNLLSVFGTWRIGDVLVIATELADRTLLDRFQEAQEQGHIGIPKFELFGYLAEAAKGIDALNDPGKSGRQRIQHRDIKPQNLLLSGGSVKVGDYGLARTLKHDVTGHTGSLTLAYAAPEFLDGTTSHFSDQYSLAITYCHLRGGRLPFEGSPVEVIQGHLKQPPDLSMIPANEHAAVGKALAKNPTERWKSCGEFVEALCHDPSHVKRTFASAVPLLENVRRSLTTTPIVRAIGAAAVICGLIVSAALSVMFFTPSQNVNDLLNSFPLSFVRYEVIEQEITTPHSANNNFAVSMSIDSEEYDQFVDLLGTQLQQHAKTSGHGNLGIPDKNAWQKGVVQFGKTSSQTLANAISEAIGYSRTSVNTPNGCVILLGRTLVESEWGQPDMESRVKLAGGGRILTVDWYYVSESASEPIRLAFRRARGIEILPFANGMALPVIRPGIDAREQIRNGTSYLPGGPAGMIFSAGMNGGDLTLMGARNFYEGAFRNSSKNSPNTSLELPILDVERVILLMPAFLVDGDFANHATLRFLGISPSNSSENKTNQIKLQPQLPPR